MVELRDLLLDAGFNLYELVDLGLRGITVLRSLMRSQLDLVSRRAYRCGRAVRKMRGLMRDISRIEVTEAIWTLGSLSLSRSQRRSPSSERLSLWQRTVL